MNELKKALALLLMLALMLTASTLPVYADDDEDDEGDEGGDGEEGSSGGLGGDGEDEEGRGMPGFEMSFAIAGALAAGRLFRMKW